MTSRQSGWGKTQLFKLIRGSLFNESSARLVLIDCRRSWALEFPPRFVVGGMAEAIEVKGFDASCPPLDQETVNLSLGTFRVSETIFSLGERNPFRPEPEMKLASIQRNFFLPRLPAGKKFSPKATTRNDLLSRQVRSTTEARRDTSCTIG